MAEGTHWYLAYTKPRSEQLAAQQLVRQGYQVYLPLYRSPKRGPDGMVIRSGPMFPRYVFFRTVHAAQSIAPVRSTIGVSHIVRFGVRPATVDDKLIAALRGFERQRESLGLPDLCSWKAGLRVAVCAGPLKGLDGLVSATAGTRVTVLLDVLGRQTRVSLPEHQIEQLSA